ncbi:unnamed protein product [Closterium sp. NIES-64]|nr:unnamed protein product [Closterium sp. NIES-64]
MNLSPHPSRTSLAPHHAAFAASAFPHAQHVTSSAVGLSPCPVPRTSLAVAVAALPGPGTLPVSPLGVAPPVASPRGAAPPGTPTLPRVHRHSASKAPPPRAAAADSASPAAASPAATPRIDRAKTAYAYDASSAAAAAAAAASSASAAAAYVSGGGVRGVDERERKRARMMGPCKEEAREETREEAREETHEEAREETREEAREETREEAREETREEATTRLQSYGAVRLGSDDTEMSDETPVPPPLHHAQQQQQQQQWYAMNLAGNTVPSSPVPPASPEVNPSSASPAPPAARLVDVEGVSVNVESDFCVPCMMGRSGLEMGEQIDGCVAPREDGEVLALRPDFLLEMMSSG